MNSPVVVEICVDSTASAVAAERGGAHRIELCSNLAEGGTTPSAGLIESVRRKVRIPLHVIIRPRSGDFSYSEDEFEIMKRDVLSAKQLGADGIVLGILKEDGHVDTDRTRCLVELARPLNATFHRAFDMSVDLNQALEDVAYVGIDRVLTSGAEQNAEDGIAAISGLVQRAKGRVAIMVGGGIRETNVRRILAKTGAREIHANVGHSIPSPMRYRNDKIALGAIKGREYQRVIVPEAKVRRLLDAAFGVPAVSSSPVF
ncbi:MAG: copper homeostasis protein CutC [Candidatus Sulfotelmatobacter sp.]